MGRWVNVSSANLLRVRYAPGVMEAVFRAAPALVYRYCGVPRETFDRIVRARSVGREFNRLVRSRPDLHPYTRRRIL